MMSLRCLIFELWSHFDSEKCSFTSPSEELIYCYSDSVFTVLLECESLIDIYNLIIYCENCVTMQHAKVSNIEYHGEFFEILHDIALTILIELDKDGQYRKEKFEWYGYDL